MSWVLVLGLAGCGGGGGSSTSTEQPAGGTAANPGGTATAENAAGGEMPDPNSQPVEFLHWRVDRMFEAQDTDQDGKITLDEFAGESPNFDRMDSNGDGFLTKQEIIDDQSATLRAEGKMP